MHDNLHCVPRTPFGPGLVVALAQYDRKYEVSIPSLILIDGIPASAIGSVFHHPYNGIKHRSTRYIDL